MGHNRSLDSVAFGLMTGQYLFSLLWLRDRHIDKTQREGQKLSLAFSPNIPDMDTNESQREQEVQT